MYAAQFATRRPAHARADGADPDTLARLNWLAAAEAEAARRARLFRTPREEREMQMMLRPVAPADAYKLFGLLLGALPPAAIFFRLLIPFLKADSNYFGLLLIAMLAVCALVGRQMGRAVSRILFGDGGRQSRTRALLSTILAALVWATATGAAGGALFFGIGAIFGVFCALAVALPAFLVFAALHRLLARGGMIDARHLRPLAWGVPATAAALILSPYLLPY